MNSHPTMKKHESQGISPPPYNSRRNGVLERRNRTVVPMARSFLKERHLPPNFWGEVVCHSIYILNRLPTRALSGKMPYVAWTKNKPDVGYVRTFGSLAYLKVPSAHVKKLVDQRKLKVYEPIPS